MKHKAELQRGGRYLRNKMLSLFQIMGIIVSDCSEVLYGRVYDNKRGR